MSCVCLPDSRLHGCLRVNASRHPVLVIFTREQTLCFSTPLAFSASPNVTSYTLLGVSDSPRLPPHRWGLPLFLPGLLPRGPPRPPFLVLSTVVTLVFSGCWSSFCYSRPKAFSGFPGFLAKTSTLNVVAGRVRPRPGPPPEPHLLSLAVSPPALCASSPLATARSTPGPLHVILSLGALGAPPLPPS